MSKYVKNLMTDQLKSRWEGVSDALLVNVVGMDVNKNVELRSNLRQQNIELVVIKNSLARRATEGTPLAPAFEGASGTLAVVWGGEDVVSLAKIVTKLSEDKQYAPFEARGGVMDGAALSADEVKAVSKWPSRLEQLSILSGQITNVGGTLSAQLLGPAAQIASQVKSKSEEA